MLKPFNATKQPRDRELSGWYGVLPTPPSLPQQTGDECADVVIIGAGYAGLSAAKRLSDLDPKLSIIVLEAQRLAWGAGGRNSGFMIDLPHELNSEDYSGGRDHDLQQISENRFAIDFAEQAIAQFNIADCFQRIGKYHGATNGKGLSALSNFSEHLTALGEPFTHLNAEQMQQLTGSEYYDGGIHTPGAALIQPAAYILGMGLGLQARDNIRVYENSPAIKITQGESVAVTTRHGTVRAGQAILANNGHIESFGLARNRLLHLVTYASMTEPLTKQQIQHLGEPATWGLIPAAPMGSTLRKITTAQGEQTRMLIRNQWTYNPQMQVSSAAVKRYAKQHQKCFARRYPPLANVTMQYQWAGAIAMSLNSVGVFGEVGKNVYAAAVCNGLGTTKSTLYGVLLADKLLGQTQPLLAHLQAQAPPKCLPPKALNAVGVPAYLKYSHWQAGRDL